MDGACTYETVGSYEGTFHIPITDWRRLIGITPAKLLFSSQRSEHESVQPTKINIEMCFCSNSYFNSVLIRQLHLVTNSLLAVKRMTRLLFIKDYAFISVESRPLLYFAEKFDLAHKEIEAE